MEDDLRRDAGLGLKRCSANSPSETYDNLSEAKRARASSPLGDLKIDLGNAEADVLDSENIDPVQAGLTSGDPPKSLSVEQHDETLAGSNTSGAKWSNAFPIRAGSGKLELVRVRGRRVFDPESSNKEQTARPSLLSKPFWDLFMEAEAELARRQETPVSHPDTSTGEAVALTKGSQDNEQAKSGDRKTGQPDENEPPLQGNLAGQDAVPSLLWTDKYRPRGFMDLLSDTALNRVVLQWIKLWDECVFNRPIKVTREKPEERNDNDNKFQKKDFVPRNQAVPELSTELDKWRRPVQPTILLAGPPGLGKTTLAHVLARHSGYNTVELNASDDRSPEAFRSALEGATQMKAVLDKECRPNCLVIDEIDGAPAQSIAVLLQMLRPPDGAHGASDKSTGTKKKKKQKVLLRPVICICNEPWGPALRQLRQVAMILHLPPTQPHRLIVRLQEVLRKERMKCDPSALQVLAEKTGNDIRSCLSTLQFLQARKGATGMVSVTDVSSAAIGDKDTQHSLGNVVRSVFSKPRSEHAGKAAATVGRQRNSTSVVVLAQSHGDYERLNQALYDTLPERAGKDADITEQLTIGFDWLCFADMLQGTMQSQQQYSLMAYGPYNAQKWQMLFASLKPIKPIMNNSYAEYRTNHIRLTNHWASLVSFISPSFLAYHSSNPLLFEVMPFIIGIIQPQMKSSNMQLLNDADRRAFRLAVDVMASFGLVYQQRMIDSQYVFQLEPNLEELVRFPGIASPFTPLTYAVKLMFSRELELQKIRQSGSEIVSKGTRKKSPEVPTGDKRKAPSDTKQHCDVKVRRDFFGRVLQPKVKAESDEPTCAPTGAPDGTGRNEETLPSKTLKEPSPAAPEVFYKFKEGFSNAVRRTLRIKQIL